MSPDQSGAPDGRQLFVYYRVALPDLGACVLAVQAFQAELQRTHPGLLCALLQRPRSQDVDGQRTLMETYAMPGGIGDALQMRIDEAATCLAPWLRGARHTEVFEPLA